MLPFIAGPQPFAVILCRFNDAPIPEISRADILKFVTTTDQESLSDYWRDVSNGCISTEGSEVFGWFTMNYSYANDWLAGRNAWVAEARRLAAENGVDLQRFKHVLAVVNAAVDDSATSVPGDLAINHNMSWGKVAGSIATNVSGWSTVIRRSRALVEATTISAAPDGIGLR